MIHLERIRDDIHIVRWYDIDGQEGFEKQLPYKAVATLVWDGSTVEICGLHGSMNRHMRKALADAIAQEGGTTIVASRKGGLKVEWYLTSEGCSTQRNRATGV